MRQRRGPRPMAKAIKLLVNSQPSFREAIAEIRRIFDEKKYVRISLSTGRDRSLEQNQLFHRWINQLAAEGGEFSFDGYRNFCRLHFFVPILIAENEKFAALWFRLFPKDGDKASRYALQMEFMDTIEGVTSICTVPQFTEGLNRMEQHYAALDTNAVIFDKED